MNFYLHALFATFLAYALFLFLAKEWLGMEVKKVLGFSALTMVLCPAVNLLIKKPLLGAALTALNFKSEPQFWQLWFLGVSLFLAPITEEAIKILPMISKAMRRHLLPEWRAYGTGFALGFGFGIGEIWYLAWGFTQKMPELANGPLFQLFGFLGERFLASFVHAFLTAIVVSGMTKKKGWQAYAVAVALHAFVNVGPALFQAKIISPVLVSIPMTFSILTLILYAFRTERNTRRSRPSSRRGKVLFKRAKE